VAIVHSLSNIAAEIKLPVDYMHVPIEYEGVRMKPFRFVGYLPGGKSGEEQSEPE
jgi:hypothetical protein